MARPNRIWFRKDTGWWMVTLGGKKVRLVEGKENKKLAEQKFHELAVLQARVPETPSARVADVIEAFLAWAKRHRSEETIRNYVWLGSFSFPDFDDILSPEIKPEFDRNRLVEEISSYEKDFPAKDRMTLLQYLDLKLYLQEAILVKVDRASMASSLEVRAPFLDHELVEFVMGLPSSLKLKGFTSKYLLKQAMSDILPTEIIQRKKKGFGVPIAKWIKGPLKELFEDMLSSRRIKQEGVFNAPYVESLLQDHLKNKKDNRKQLWTLLIWELWVDCYNPSL